MRPRGALVPVVVALCALGVSAQLSLPDRCVDQPRSDNYMFNYFIIHLSCGRQPHGVDPLVWMGGRYDSYTRLGFHFDPKNFYIECLKDIKDYTCEDISEINFGRNDTIKELRFKYCPMTFLSIECIKRRLGVRDVLKLAVELPLGGFRGLREDMEGLRGLRWVTLTGEGEDVTITSEAMAPLSALERLDLSWVRLRLVPGALAILHALTHLELNYAQLSDRNLPPGALANLPALTHLSLTHNWLKNITHDTFQNLTSLEVLDVSGNQLSLLDGAVLAAGCPHLRELIATDNPIGTLRSLEPLQHLEKLDISHSLEDNFFSKLSPRALGTLPRLEHVDMSWSGWHVLPADLLAGSKSLLTLNLKNNKLSTLPASLFNDQRLLKNLRLSWNRLDMLPQELFSSVVELQQLRLNYNQLRTVPASLFTNLRMLELLDLSNNYLETLSQELFSNLVGLQELHLYDNHIRSLPASIFTNQRMLQDLNLSSNKLETLPQELFSNLAELKRLNLNYNLFKVLPEKVDVGNGTTNARTHLKKIKSLLLSNRVLAHYDPERPLTLTCDASSTGVGGVLTQPDGRGGERPVACVSRKLNAAERNYSQIHKEALAIVFSTNKFHQYLYGRRFTLKTDHKPLVSIFGPQMGVPSMTSSRMQRWALILTGYNFDIEYVNTNSNCADALSRLPIGEQKEFEPPEQSYLHFASDALLLDNNEIKLMTSRDPLLGRVINYIKNGWPESVDIKELQPYYNRRRELYLELNCVMWGHRVVIPESCRQKVIKELHEPHMGIVKTKAMARSYVWWPGLDEAIEACCQSCSICAAVAAAPPASAPIPWHWPARPYERVHIDFLGPIGRQTYLIAIDARTKWIEVYKMNRTSADTVISKLRESWSRWGIPKQLVSDNGPPFNSKEFNLFLKANGVNHMYSAPYHPSSNGAAEGAVKLIKNVIKKANLRRVDIDVEIHKFLLHYHNTPHSTTGESPARMLQGRDLRIRLDLLKPDKTGTVLDKQAKSVERDKRPCRELSTGEQVSYRDYRSNKKWSEGTIIEKVGKSDYRIAAEDGNVHHRHVDQMKRRLRNSCVFPSDVNAQNRPEMAPQVVSGQNTSERIENKIGDAQSDIFNKQGESGISGSPCQTPPLVSSQPTPEKNNERFHISSSPSPPDPSAVTTKRNRKPPIRFGLDID